MQRRVSLPTDGISRRGFTIVELLIVVVVVAILAAITIVAYNGISNQAKKSAAQSAIQQTAKKIASYAVTNNEDYPASLAVIGVVDDGSTTYQYSVNNNSSPHTFCVTVTVATFSYFMSNTQQSPQEGGCPGHGQGGVASITNLITNPGFEHGANALEVRRNLVRYPNAELATTAGWVGANSGAISSVAERSHSGDRSFRVVTPGVATSEGISQSTSSATGPISSSGTATETLSIWVYAPVGATLIFAVEEYIPDGAYIATRGTVNITGNGDWQRVSAQGTKATASNILRSYVRTRVTPQAITFYVDDALNENKPTLLPYFDGSVSSDSDLTAVWTGIANQSESILRGSRPNSVGTGHSAPIISNQWSGSGRSLRIIPIDSSNDSFAELVGLFQGSGLRGFVPGATYTVVGTARLTQPLSGSAQAPRASFRIGWSTPSGQAETNPPGYSTPNTAGINTVRHTFTVPASATSLNFFRIYNGVSVGNGDVWWDDLMVVEGSYTGLARNGDSANWIWNGMPNNSTSTGPGQ